MLRGVKSLWKNPASHGCLKQCLSDSFSTRKLVAEDILFKLHGYSILFGRFSRVVDAIEKKRRREINIVRNSLIQNVLDNHAFSVLC